jgi:hypothetical protein
MNLIGYDCIVERIQLEQELTQFELLRAITMLWNYLLMDLVQLAAHTHTGLMRGVHVVSWYYDCRNM